MSKEIANEYASSLSDLPLINMLTTLAEENVEHAEAIVHIVEKYLEKVHPDMKLPVLYLVDSIIKNVGGAYVQKFSEIIVNMFTRTFKRVDVKARSEMYILRHTWHDVFEATKLYQLDVIMNLIDPAWPIQAQPQQSNIHENNPYFMKKPATTQTTSTGAAEDEENMQLILAQKEHELLMLQKELENARRALEIAATTKSTTTNVDNTPTAAPSTSAPGVPSARLLIPLIAAAAAAPQDNSITYSKQLHAGEPLPAPDTSDIENLPLSNDSAQDSQDTSDYVTDGDGRSTEGELPPESTEDSTLEETTETTEATTVTEKYIPKTTPKFKKLPPKFYSKLSYFEKPSFTAASPNLVERAGRRRFRSNCRCEKISNCPKLQITVPRCPEEYFLCCF